MGMFDYEDQRDTTPTNSAYDAGEQPKRSHPLEGAGIHIEPGGDPESRARIDKLLELGEGIVQDVAIAMLTMDTDRLNYNLGMIDSAPEDALRNMCKTFLTLAGTYKAYEIVHSPLHKDDDDEGDAPAT